MSYYDEELENLQKMKIVMEKLCNWLQSNIGSEHNNVQKITEECRVTFKEFEVITNGMKDFDWRKVMSIKDQNTLNEKLKHSFKPSSKDIETVYEKRQTLLQQKFELFKDNSEHITQQKKHCDDKDNEIRKLVNLKATDVYIKASRIKNSVQDLTSYMTLLGTRLQAKQQSIANFVYDLKLSTDQMLLPSSTLFEGLTEIRDVLRKTQRDLPFQLIDQSVDQFYNIATMDATLIDNFIVIQYELPIVEDEHFTFFHLNSYPRKIEAGMFELVLPDVHQIAVSKDFKK